MLEQVCTQWKVRSYFYYCMNLLDIQAYLEHEDVRKFNLGAALRALCYIIAHSSNSTLLLFWDPPEALLNINYLQNMITAFL